MTYGKGPDGVDCCCSLSGIIGRILCSKCSVVVGMGTIRISLQLRFFLSYRWSSTNLARVMEVILSQNAVYLAKAPSLLKSSAVCFKLETRWHSMHRCCFSLLCGFASLLILQFDPRRKETVSL